MGRPIKKSFFGNNTAPYNNVASGGTTGVGGYSINDIEIADGGSAYTTSTTFNLIFSDPDISGGVTAVGTAASNISGVITSVTLTNAGTGYLNPPIASVDFVTTGSDAVFAVSLNIVRTLNVTANINGVTASADVMKQEGSKRYLVQNANGVATCLLVASDTLSENQMNIIATDVNSSTYFVSKLTSKKANITNRTSTSTAVTTASVTAWTIDQPSGTIVTLAPPSELS